MAVKNAGNLSGAFEQVLGQPDVTARLPEPVTEWVMVIVRPGMEQEARDTLRRRGVGAWWPNYPSEVGAKDRETGKRFRRRVLAGVLPGVILCPARLTQVFWSALDLAPGVINVARKPNTEPVLLNDIDIAVIHAIEAGLNRSEPPKGEHSYSIKDKVRLVADELRRLPAGIVTELRRDGHIVVDINLFGGMTRMVVLADQIEPIDGGGKNQPASRSTDARDRPAKSPRRR